MRDSSIGKLLFLSLFLVPGAISAACAPAGEPLQAFRSNDPADYKVDSSQTYRIEISEPTWIVPSASLPPEVEVMPSNNNVDIAFHETRLFLAWRTAPTHFASDETRMYVLSSNDEGVTWDFEVEVAFGTDIREPRLLSYRGILRLIFFEGGSDPLRFSPRAIWSTTRKSLGDWSEAQVLIDDAEVPWDIKVRNGLAYMTSYTGAHYGGEEGGGLDLHFKYSSDGETWEFVDEQPFVYRGGVSEAAFELDSGGALWAVTRNEDGDSSGKGSHICRADAQSLGSWTCSAKSSPHRYDSPEMFRHGEEIYLVARRDIGGPFGEDSGLLPYSTRPKRTALYRLDRENLAIEHIQDLPSAGDTAFPAIWRLGPHEFLLANYTSPLDEPDISWMEGQLNPGGTQLYFLRIRFVPDS